MKVSKDQMQANRRRILDAAGQLFREKGFEAVSVAEVMKAAGLTHGGFYGHFASKDDLIAQTIGHIFTAEPSGADGAAASIGAYLSPRHRDGVGDGCPTAALVSDIRRQTPEARRAMSDGVRSQIALVGRMIGADGTREGSRQAIGAWAAMVGALIIARATDEDALSDEILAETRLWIEESLSRRPDAT